MLMPHLSLTFLYIIRPPPTSTLFPYTTLFRSNVHVDIGARCAELGRQPYTAREFFLKYSDRILFGTDLVPDVNMYRLHFRFLETADEYFEYPSHASRQGRWNIYGLFLPDEILRRVYRENAFRLLKR